MNSHTTIARHLIGPLTCPRSFVPNTARINWNTFFFTDTTTTEIYTLSLHDALPISLAEDLGTGDVTTQALFQANVPASGRSEEHTSELQSLRHLVCRLLLEKKKKKKKAVE